MENRIKRPIIGICGVARAGKDTLFECLKSILSTSGLDVQRFALADELKSDINDFTTKNYGISSYTIVQKEKELIRPLMVVHGKIKRQQSEGKHWTGLLTSKIFEALEDKYVVPVVTDIRYDYYVEDEVFWCKNILNASLVHVTRLVDGAEIGPANTDEADNEPKLLQASDHKLRWSTTPDVELRKEFVKTQLIQLLNQICQIYSKPLIQN